MRKFSAILFIVSLACITATHAFAANNPPQVISITPSEGTSQQNHEIVFTSTYSDPDGATNINLAHILVNTSQNLQGVAAYYNNNTNKLYLLNEQGTPTGGFAPGSFRTIRNSFCKLSCARTRITKSANTITITWAITFTRPFSGRSYNTYLMVSDKSGLQTGWVQKGVWTVNYPPVVVGITPYSGKSRPDQEVRITSIYNDKDKTDNISIAQILVNASPDSRDCFAAYYDNNTNKLYMLNDQGAAVGGFAPGSLNMIENSYAKIDCSKTTVVRLSARLRINWFVTFKPSFSGLKNSYLSVSDKAGSSTGWVLTGQWNVILPPKIVITSPTDGAIVNTPNLTVYYTVNGVAKTKQVLLTEGLNTITITETDSVGNTSSSSIKVTLDTLPPVITITSPQDGTIVDTPTITVNYMVDGIEKTKQASLVPGQNIITITETDAAGNSSSASISVTLAKPPVITVLDPANSSFSSTVTIRGANFGTHDEFSSVTFYNNKRAEIARWFDDYIVCVVPVGAETGPVTVTTKSGISNSATFTVLNPHAPQGLSAALNGNVIDISWTANTETDLEGYNLYFSRTSGEYADAIDINDPAAINYQLPISAFGASPSSAQSTTASQSQGVPPKVTNSDNKLNFSSDEIIVKIKPQQAAAASSPSTTKGISQAQVYSLSGISALNRKHGARKIDKLFRKAASKPSKAMAMAVSVTTRVPDLSGIYRIKVRKGSDVRAVVKEYIKNPNVEYAEPVYRYRVFSGIAPSNYYITLSAYNTAGRTSENSPAVAINYDPPNDPYYSSRGTWGQGYDDMWGLYKIKAKEAWVKEVGNKDITVAVVDTGCDYNHPDLSAKIWINKGEIPNNGIDDDGNGYIDDVRGWNFISFGDNVPDNNPMDGNGHGTHVAGTVAASTDNGVGVAGICWNAGVMALKGLDDTGTGYTDDLAQCVTYAADNGARVINMSWGGNESSRLLSDSLDYAHAEGVVLVAAAGNDNSDVENFYPANFPQVITVAATDAYDNKASFSNWGTKIDVAAPGVDILSLRANGTDFYQDGSHIVNENYYLSNGTSMAAPHVSGLAALLLSMHPEFSNEGVRQVIRNGADDLGSQLWDEYFGYGRINALKSSMINTPTIARIAYPASGSTIAGGIIDITGSTCGAEFSRYILEYGKGKIPSAWNTVTDSTTQVQDGVLGTLTVPQEAGLYTIRLKAYDIHGFISEDRITCYVPVAGFYFENVAEDSGVAGEGYGTGCCFFDMNNDGHPDLYTTREDGPDKLFINNGDGTFTEQALGPEAVNGFDVISGDYNNDGYADLFVIREDHSNLYLNHNGASFIDKAAEMGVDSIRWNLFGAMSYIKGVFADYNLDGFLDLFIGYGRWGGSPPIFGYLNLGGAFINIDEKLGLQDVVSNYAADAIIFFDYNNDDNLDMLISRGGGKTGWNLLFKNNGDGTYSDVTISSGLAPSDGSWIGTPSRADCAVGDYDNDGYQDILAVNKTPFVSQNIYLYHNKGDGTFENVTVGSGILFGWSVGFFDFDNDGYLDIFEVRDDMEDIVYLNQKDGTFLPLSVKTGQFINVAGAGLGISTGGELARASIADYDNDGDLDIYVSRRADAGPFINVLYSNKLSSGNNWIKIELKGRYSSTSGYGARIKVNAGALRMMREATYAQGMCSTENVINFGLGSYDKADSIEVKWPNGVLQTLTDVSANQTVVIEEPDLNYPPPVPTDVAPLAASGKVIVTWEVDDAGYVPGIMGYSIYRSTVQGSSYTKLNLLPLPERRYVDTNVVDGTTYYYIVTTVSQDHLIESGYSDEAAATPWNYGTRTIGNLVITEATSSSFLVKWNTDVPTTFTLDYGLDEKYGSSITSGAELKTTHSVLVAGLKPNTKYHLMITVNDRKANQSRTSDLTVFTTNSTEPAGLTIFNLRILYCSKNMVSVFFNTDKPASSTLEYGLTDKYGVSVAGPVNWTCHLVSTHPSQQLLSAGTLYHYRIACSYDGGTVTSSDATFTTPLNDLFNDVSSESCLTNSWGPTIGRFAFDYNNDGAEDIYILNENYRTNNIRNFNILYNNSGTPDYHFTDITDMTLLRGTENVSNSGATCNDFDGDGYLDILIFGNGINYLFKNKRDSTFEEVAAQTGIDKLSINGMITNSIFFDYDNDGYLDLLVDVYGLFKNDNGQIFSLANGDITFGRATRGAVEDYDNDGDMDFFCVRTLNGNIISLLTCWRNNSDGTFSETALKDLGFKDDDNVDDIVFGDYDDDGDMDALVTCYNTAAGYRLYRNMGAETGKYVFTEATDSLRFLDVYNFLSYFNTHASFIDIDNDGDLDILMSSQNNTREYSNQGIETGGNYYFIEDAGPHGLRHAFSGTGSYLCPVDYDNDGGIDLLGRYALYKNAGNSNHWLKVKLQSMDANTKGVGARVRVITGGVTQSRTIGCNSVRLQNSLIAHFGLGANDKADIEVVWPGGKAVSRLRDVSANQTITVEYPVPTITNIDPVRALPGEQVTIRGVNFGDTQGAGFVKFYNDKLATIVSWSDTAIVCIVPEGMETGPVTVTTEIGTSRTVTVTVNDPVIETTSLPEGWTEKNYECVLSAIYGTTPYSWSVEGGVLPPGLSLDGTTGRIYGIPSAEGTCGFVVRITDSKSRSATQGLSISINLTPPVRNDEELLDETQARAALYFYDEALTNGFVKDGNHKDFSSIAATGFGLASLCIMAERSGTTANWTVTPEMARARANQILDECIRIQGLQTTEGNECGIAGFLYHFVTEAGTRQGSSEVSTIDMALFLSGAITAGEYFGAEVKDKSAQVFNKVNWDYFLVRDKKQFSHGVPYAGSGATLFMTWDRPGDEAILVSLMAIASDPDNQSFLETMYSWPRVAREYGGHSVVNSYFGALFTYIFGHCFFDFEKLGEDNPSLALSPGSPVNWWTNSVNAAKANRQFCIDQSVNFSSYGPDSWGITACEYPGGGYAGLLGAQPSERSGGIPLHDGTIAPYGAISCMPLLRTSANEKLSDNQAFRALRYFYDTYYGDLWNQYGPRDSFNHMGEFNPYSYGLDLGSIVIMIENYRSRLVWDTFMKNDNIMAATGRVFGENDLPPQKTLYVDAANAADPNQDGSQAHPFDAIQKAVDAGGMISIINISSGQYAEAVKIVSKLKIVLNGVIADRANPTNAQLNTVMINGGNSPISVTIEGSREVTVDSIVISGDGRHENDSVGGISVKTSNTVTIKNTIIKDVGHQLSAGTGIGGIASINTGKVVIADNVIQNNQGMTSAGIYVEGSDIQGESSDVAILHNDVLNNFVYGGSGGIYVTGIANVSVTANRLYCNRSIWYGHGYGNWASIEPGLTVVGATRGEINNNLLAYNKLDNGYGWHYGYPGINCYSSNVLVSNNTLQCTGGIYIRGCSPIIKNNIVYSGTITNEGDGSPFVGYNDIVTYFGSGTPGYGNISEDPMFISPDTADGSPDNDDYHFKAMSPCINAGDPDPAFNDKDGTRNDMGIYGGPDSPSTAPRFLDVPQDYQTIQAGIDAANAGDVIRVAAGTYCENLVLNKSGIILQGDNKLSILDGSGDLYTYPQICKDISSQATMIIGFTIQNGGITCESTVNSLRIERSNIYAGISIKNGASVLIADNNIAYPNPNPNTAAWVTAEANNNIYVKGNCLAAHLNISNGNAVIINNIISGLWDGAIRLYSNTLARITNNVIRGNTGWAFAAVTINDSTATLSNNIFGGNYIWSNIVAAGIASTNSHVELYNNIFENHSGGTANYPPSKGVVISCFSNTSMNAVNNIFIGNENGSSAVYSDGAGTQYFSYNDFWDNSTNSDIEGFSLGIGNIQSEPAFIGGVTLFDYHLQPGSSCIDSGDPNSQYNDLDGTRNDMGIYGGPTPMKD